uniref:Pyridoxamine 5'-phosphate oxidase N-terminal domain-containing protein n=1 Tax=Alexandrium monilatum TaxID=311494 RepID=A0A7S4T0Z7_9DINO|mmetsp:Transcript_68723/g.212554  ORF Transcript_68723/g.212554 Transcript_68723/m.212554 type:complete len:266 (-) Transcript_68723:59-856(-)
MGRWFEAIGESHAEWMREQRLFFVATAAARGHVNVSPKGHAQETFAVLGANQVAYLDMTGSGNETFAHSKVDGRITVMFIALSGAPKIMRLHGRCRCLLKDDVPHELRAKFSERFVSHKGFRAVMVVDVSRVSSSCGYSIPLYDFVEDRSTLFDTFEKKSEEEVEDYLVLKNSFSIDCLPAAGHRKYSSRRPSVAMRLTDGTGKLTPGAKDGFWFGVKDHTFLEAVQAWLCQGVGVGELLSLRDLAMIGLGAAAAFTVMRRRAAA